MRSLRRLSGYDHRVAPLAEATHICAIGFPQGTDKLAEAGLTTLPGTVISAPYIVEAPAAFERRRHTTLEIGKSRQIILGEIVYAHYHADIVGAERLRIDPAKLDAIARLGGATCSTIRDRFEMPTPTPAEETCLGFIDPDAAFKTDRRFS